MSHFVCYVVEISICPGNRQPETDGERERELSLVKRAIQNGHTLECARVHHSMTLHFIIITIDGWLF